MRGIRRKVGTAALAIGASVALAVVGAAPAFAGDASGASSELFCSPGTAGNGQPIMDCGVGAYFFPGVHHIKVTLMGRGNTYLAGSSIPCPAGADSNPFGFTDTRWPAAEAPGAKYKVTVVDCYGDKDVYKVDQAGDVTVIKSTVTSG